MEIWLGTWIGIVFLTWVLLLTEHSWVWNRSVLYQNKVLDSEIKAANLFFIGSFGICPHMTEDNKDLIQGKDLLVAYYDVDYEKNAKGSNYWRNRYAVARVVFICFSYLVPVLVLFRSSIYRVS